MSYDDLEKDYDRQIVDHAETYGTATFTRTDWKTSGRLLKRSLKARM